MRYRTEKRRIEEAYRSIYEAKESIAARTQREWRRFLNGRMPAIETSDGDIIYYDYDPKTDSFIYGGETNSGIIAEGSVPYDHDIPMFDNAQNVVEEIESRYRTMAEESVSGRIGESIEGHYPDEYDIVYISRTEESYYGSRNESGYAVDFWAWSDELNDRNFAPMSKRYMLTDAGKRQLTKWIADGFPRNMDDRDVYDYLINPLNGLSVYVTRGKHGKVAT